ncbi:MAG: DUF1622 domain-containing protein [Polymorphobacter sp.]|uniref:DUF1622 domain-containing protein n=1 Tax=Polymorphobacter sp. TaxID=1909290 RepID=UPI003A874ABE
MEEYFFEVAGLVALVIEAAVVLILAVAALQAAARLARMLATGETAMAIRRDVWLKFGAALALALEFALAADIIRSTIAPTWDAIGKLAVIAAIRTLLNLFLMRDLESLAGNKEERE